jgi:methionyl-tRNA formyltransferase
MPNSLSFAYFGTPGVALDTLEILYTNGYKPKVIITSPDRASGRGLIVNETPVAVWAHAHNIECLKPEKITEEFIDSFSKYEVDISIVVAYGKILPEKIITLPKYGTLNIHYSLLPLYRGASPLEQALLDGKDETGISIQQMAYKLDSGPTLIDKVVPIHIQATKEEIRDTLIEEGALTLVALLPKIIGGSISPKVQDETKATFCTKIKKENGEINLADSPRKNYDKYRAYFGWPGTFFFVTRDGKNIRVKINNASFENETFVIKSVTPEGKKEIAYEDFVRNFSK